MPRLTARNALRYLATGALAAGAACGAPAEPAVVRSECGGIECVTSHRPEWSPERAWRLSAEPLVSVGRARAEDPASGFGVINGLARMPDGSIVVADGMSRQLHFLAADGVWQASHGRAGEGPGEYVNVFWMQRCWPDRLGVLDRGQSLVEVAADGRQLGRRSLIDLFGQRSTFQACDGEGGMVGIGIDIPAWQGRTEPGVARVDGEALWVDIDSGDRVTLGRFPIGEIHQRLSDAGFHPLGRVTQVAAGGGRIWIGTADSFALDQFDRSGRQVLRAARALEPVELDPGRVRELLDRVLADLPPYAQEFWRGRLGPDDNPPTLPAYDAVLADPEGNAWVRPWAVPGEHDGSWSVFGPDGRWLGDVTMPRAFEPFEIGRDHVLGVSPDDLGNPEVRLYRLER